MNSRVAAMGIPKFLKDNSILDKLCVHGRLKGGKDEAGSMTKKSSRIWQTNEMRQ